jgi:oxygen-independent coproporphyrinogen-3 oxidase
VTEKHLYVHVPFCARRCAYCDFSIAVRRNTPISAYLSAINKELEIRNAAGSLTTLYLGGGTPSRLGGTGVNDLVSLVRKRFEIEEGAEITIEANPADVTIENANAWRDSGINRVSLGVQSFDDTVLKWMHRDHDSETAVTAFQILRDAGFENISIDLIFALPEALSRSWESDLTRALDLGPDHVSLYGLTIEPATPLGRWTERGSVTPSDDDRYAEEFLLADLMAASAGLEHYEVSNFAKPGKRSRHNSAYWSGAHYIGVGPSAHSFDGHARSWNVSAYADWTSRLSRGVAVTMGSEELTPENMLAEKVYLGLRTRDGMSVTASDYAPVGQWTDRGWATVEGDVVRLTSEGWLRLDSLAAALTSL